MEQMQSMESESKVFTSEKYHTLNDKWVLWAHLPHDTDWTLKSYKEIYEISNIETVNAINKTIPEKMVKNCMLFLMRKNINPVWEDPLNCNGGCFSFKVLNKNVLRVWKELSYSMTGETLSNKKEFMENINGITISPKKSFCIIGDGEMQEGQIWEAAMYAAGNNIDNIISTVDYNGKQIDGSLDDVLSLGNLKMKWDAFGWKTLEVDNGNDLSQVIAGLNLAKSLTGKGQPIVILMKTEMGNGVDYMMGTHKWHGSAPNEEQLESALNQLNETLGDY